MVPKATLAMTTMRVVLLAPLEGIPLTWEDERSSTDGPNLSPLFTAWREEFRAIPSCIATELVFFDLVRSFRMSPERIARLIHNLSAVLRRRSQGRLRCRIIGCKTLGGRKYIEQSTVNVVSADAGMNEATRPNAYKEYAAGSPAFLSHTRPD
ncbi:hypothetical protein LTR37_008852 [Vermiconidia calcicola]|uniref:Uncharacterized protein n=1 Tax=Vermiconidia calcicola TaxID=1690605 RepID=A0ACC3N9D1_9PEZI|nr:hypothetical protein LTR37_008852 [Vermiconidia calcicola]